jgi:Tol biopolymer transport system component
VPGHPAQSPNVNTLWPIDPDGANLRQIFDRNNLSRWLPDGSDILTRVARTSYLYDLANTRHRQISTQPNAESMPILNWVTGASRSLARDEVDEDLRSIGCAAAEANV